MHPQNFTILGIYIQYNAENEMMLSLCHYINSFSPEGATNMSTFYLQYFLLIVYIETFLHSLLKFYIEQKFVWFCYLVVFISTLVFCYLFYLVLLLKITLFNTVHCDENNLTRL